jgi:hypothetical protein
MEEHGLRAFENRVLRRIFGQKAKYYYNCEVNEIEMDRACSTN